MREEKPKRILRLLAEVEAQAKEDSSSLIAALEFRRDQYELTQAEFAFVLGLYPSHYNEIIKGKRALPLRATKRAFAIGVPASALLQSFKKEGK